MSRSGDKHITITVELDSDIRLDRYLSEHTELDLSRTKIQKLIEQGLVLINGTPPIKKQILSVGDKIEISIPPPEPSLVTPEKIDLDVVYEDDHLAVINKPAGMVTHPGAGNRTGTLVNAMLHRFGTLATSSASDRPGIVHRLDKNTSGLLIIAKTDKAYSELQKMMEQRLIKRTYHAIVWGHLADPKGTIDLPLGRSKRDRKKMAVAVGGRSAVTHYRLLERFRSFSYLELQLETGRTHQIRVHLAHLGHPVFGDPEYGGRDKSIRGLFAPERSLAKELLAMLSRQALHAIRLQFKHPLTNEKIELESTLPDDYKNVLEILRREGA